MKALDSDDDNYERAERLAIQSESTAPESATKFPFGHNADGGPEQIVDGLGETAGGVAEATTPDPFNESPAEKIVGGAGEVVAGFGNAIGGVIQTLHKEGGTAVADNENSETVRDPPLLGPDCE